MRRYSILVRRSVYELKKSGPKLAGLTIKFDDFGQPAMVLVYTAQRIVNMHEHIVHDGSAAGSTVV